MPNSIKLMALFILMAMAPSVKATHLLGGELTHERIEGMTTSDYRIRLVLYRDMSGIPLGNTQSVKHLNSGGINMPNIVVQLDSVKPLPLGCSDTAEIYYYSKDINIYQWDLSNTNIFSWSTCCRPGDVQNIVTPDNQGLYVESRMFPFTYVTPTGWVQHPHSSIQYYGPPVLAAYSTSNVDINFGAYHPEGDSISFALTAPREEAGNQVVGVPLDSAYKPKYPFDTNTVTLFDAQTGQLEAINPPVGKYTVAVRVQWFKNGILMGQTFRDVTILIKPGLNDPNLPTTQINNVSVGHGQYSFDGSDLNIITREGETVEFDYNVTPSVLANGQMKYNEASIYGYDVQTQHGGMSSNPSAAEFYAATGTLIDTGAVQAHFKFVSQIGVVYDQDTVKTFGFMLEGIAKDSCGLSVADQRKLTIHVLRNTIWAVNDTVYGCENSVIYPHFTGDTSNVQWSPTTGVINPNSANSGVTLSQSTSYTLWNLNDSSRADIYIEVDTLLGHMPLNQVNQTLSIPNFPAASHNKWYYRDLEISRNTLQAYMDCNGKYYSDIEVGYCINTTDTVHFNRKNHAQSVLENMDMHARANANRFQIDFTPYYDSDLLGVTLPIGRADYHPFNQWRYEIVEGNNLNNILDSGFVVYANGYMTISNLNIPLDSLSTYRLSLLSNPNQVYSQTLPVAKPGQFPYLDDNGILNIKGGGFRKDGQIFNNGFVAYADFELKLPNINIHENEFS
ncbi:MAG: hypothetical protein N4A46_14540, partial [Schleiferiaceae bacterium]|nr:hypothetical protein [Schleiferiaceae bacterium]